MTGAGAGLRATRWWLWCWWFRRHRWRTMYNFTMGGMPCGYVCQRCGRRSSDLMEPIYQGQRKGWML